MAGTDRRSRVDHVTRYIVVEIPGGGGTGDHVIVTYKWYCHEVFNLVDLFWCRGPSHPGKVLRMSVRSKGIFLIIIIISTMGLKRC